MIDTGAVTKSGRPIYNLELSDFTERPALIEQIVDEAAEWTDNYTSDSGRLRDIDDLMDRLEGYPWTVGEGDVIVQFGEAVDDPVYKRLKKMVMEAMRETL